MLVYRSIVRDSAVSLSRMIALSVGHRTCDSQVMGLSPRRAPLRSGLMQVTLLTVRLCDQAVFRICSVS